jgi:DNA-binding transcriptional ArsR family regulator
MTQPRASTHLRVLRQVGLMRDRKAGKLRLYALDARGLQRVHAWTGGFERSATRASTDWTPMCRTSSR